MLRVAKYLLTLLVVLSAFGKAMAQEASCTNAETIVTTASDATSEQTSDFPLEEEQGPKSYKSLLRDIHVHYDNDRAWPRWELAQNAEARQRLMEVVAELAADEHKGRTIVIEGAASPIGSDKYNNALALRRASVLRDVVRSFEGGDKLDIRVLSVGEDWSTFAANINNNYHEANREQVLAAVRKPGTNDEKERRLYAIDRGRTWRMLVDKYMDSSRNAAVVRIVETASVMEHLPLPEIPAEVKPAEHLLAPVYPTPKSFAVVEEPRRYPVLAFRSNLLLPALNVGVEVPIGNSWSVGLDYYYPWAWPKSDNKDCFELLTWGLEGRYWFGRNRTEFDRLQGHSLGLYGYVGYYDFERDYRGSQGEFFNVGIDYTYAVAVGKRKSVHFEFSLGVGYIYSEARKYTVIEPGSPLISDKITKQFNFIGPTKATISLVVPVFRRTTPLKRVVVYE